MILGILFGILLPIGSVPSVYPGIDFVLHKTHDRLEYDWVIRPGADPALIRTAIAPGATALINTSGELVVHVGGTFVRHSQPVAFQDIAGHRVPVDAAFAIDRGAVTFRLGPYDHRHSLVIDPVVKFTVNISGDFCICGIGPQGHGTYPAEGQAVTVDASGKVWWVGKVYKFGDPVPRGFLMEMDPSTGANLLQRNFDTPVSEIAMGPSSDAVYLLAGTAIVKLTVDGTQRFSIPNDTQATRLAVDSTGTLYALSPGSLKAISPDGQVKFTRSLNFVAVALAVDSKRNVYIGGKGSHISADTAIGPTSPDQIVIQTFDPSGAITKTVSITSGYSVQLPADSLLLRGIAVDADGGLYFTAWGGADFPVTPNTPFSSYPAEGEGTVVAKLGPGGSSLAWANFFPGTFTDPAVSSTGIFVIGHGAASTPVFKAMIPDEPRAYCPVYTASGSSPIAYTECDAHYRSIASFDRNGTLAWSTLFPFGSAAAADLSGNLYVVGARSGASIAGVSPTDNGVDVPHQAVRDAVAFQPGVPAPGGLGALFVRGLPVATTVPSGYPLPTQIAGVTLSDGLPLLGIFNFGDYQQINFQMPQSSGDYWPSSFHMPLDGAIVLHYRGVSTVINAPVAPAGAGPILHAADFTPVTPSSPAHPNELLTLYCSGLGKTVAAPQAGETAPGAPLSTLVSTYSAVLRIGTAIVRPDFTGLAPGTVGVYQLNFRTPADFTPGDYALQIDSGIPGLDYPGSYIGQGVYSNLLSNALILPIRTADAVPGTDVTRPMDR